ncbi:hypothetical protein [Bradyrhizobium neotropicale]|uniref:hypothetical protein n=1 Tax=Bradyrhizobium neotropicale TaxID=1497615 RepID=UPI001AD667A5|nr:hypothetical protein [Bradyrhizobium neotropicale]MBO4228022.1 hypothetical protein [Bradyrhizobium neotropicale]
MTSLDDISFKLGELTNGQKDLFRRMDKNDEERAETRALLASINTKLDSVVTDTAWMKPHVKSYAALRGRAGWVGSFFVTVGGIFGGAVGNWLLKKYGG